MMKPKKLEPGSTIGLVAPSGVFVRTKFKRGCDFLTSKGFKLVIGRFAHNKYGYLAGKDDERAIDINEMFDNDSIDAIMCIRGGYGANRILDKIDYDLIRKKPKIFVGFSDATALQLSIYKHSNVVTFYGPMLSFDFGSDISEYTCKCFFDVVYRAKPYGEIPYPGTALQNFKIITPGFARGEIIGGCISLIQTLISTNHIPSFSGKILFLEDAGEHPYRLDRMLNHLKNAGIFDDLLGVIFGNTDIPRHSIKRDLSIEEILHDIFKDYDYPVVYDLPFGHCKNKITIPQGILSCFSTSARSLYFEESGVID
ncbi:LD-carboxypeptidase [bacterium]|nr:LD-carboxypeptidase [bacterium]